ncbi:MAG: hypothetical protein HYZ48_03225 [Chlamydiales bacterium]|nr:hypothetical protein [Chlamydiales bacterium]
MISVYSKFHIDRLLEIGNRGISILLSALAVLGIGMWCFYPWDVEWDLEEVLSKTAQGARPFPYESIGMGPLTLNPQHPQGWVSHLAKQLCILAYNSRPDALEKESPILLTLKTEKITKTISSGKTLFLARDSTSDRFLFSEEAQELSIKPILLDNGRVLIEAYKKSRETEEKGQFIVSSISSKSESKHSAGSKAPFSALRQGKCWGKDLLIRHHGGNEFEHWKERYKLEFFQGSTPYVCFVAEGDYLCWSQGRWERVESSELPSEESVALVKSASPKGIELTAWDEMGFYPVSVQIPLEHPGAFSPKSENWMSRVRLRTPSQVSCMLGKKRFILKQGDWILKTSTGWRNLHRKEEIENCLYHRIKGDLFVFQSLEKEQGRFVLKGNLFDEMRSQMHNVSIPIEPQNPTGKGKKRK